jgi:hypothetical protein
MIADYEMWIANFTHWPSAPRRGAEHPIPGAPFGDNP